MERFEWSKRKRDECSVFSNSRRSARGCSKSAALSEYHIPCVRIGNHVYVWRLRDTKKRQIMTAVDGSNLRVTTQCRMMCPKKVRTSCNRQLNAGSSTERRAVNSTQGRQLNAGLSTQRRDVNSTQVRPLICCKAVSSMLQGRQLQTAGPSTKCKAVSSTQGRRLNAGASSQCNAVMSMQGRRTRFLSSVLTLLCRPHEEDLEVNCLGSQPRAPCWPR